MDDQEWFWSEEWQQKERDVDENIRMKRIEEFDSVDELIDFLDRSADME